MAGKKGRSGRPKGSQEHQLPSDFRDEAILSHAEIVRIAAKYPRSRARGRTAAGTPTTLTDIQRLMKLGLSARYSHRRKFWGWLKGETDGFTRRRRRQLSRYLMLLEAGQLRNDRGGTVILPEPTRKPETIVRLVLAEQKIGGRIILKPTIVRGDPLPTARVLPSFKSFVLPGV